jgi:trans-aconitate methyltransferase
MQTPWEQIPLEDYEGHMAHPSIDQAKMLADQLVKLIAQHNPTSVAIIGCAGGNGLQHLEATCIKRVVAIDINPKYIAAAKSRLASRLKCLDLRCADVQSEQLQFESVELTYAALIFEYVDTASTLATLKRNLRAGGTLAVILQLPHSHQPSVSPSPYRSLDKLASALRLVEPDTLITQAIAAGFKFVGSETIDLSSGKQFLLQTFRH